jgi:hypothetical protein
MRCLIWLILIYAHLIGGVISPDYAIRKLTVNDHLLVFFEKSSSQTVRYQCLPPSQPTQKEIAPLSVKSTLISVAVGSRQSQFQTWFVVFEKVDAAADEYLFYMTKVTVNCNSSEVERKSVFFDRSTYSKHNNYIGDVDPDGRFALAFTDRAVLFYDLATLQQWNHSMSWSTNFLPMAIEITNRFVFVAGIFTANRSERLLLHLMTVNYRNTGFNMTIVDTWNFTLNLGPPHLEKDASQILLRSAKSHLDEKVALGLRNPPTFYLFTVNESLQLHLAGSKAERSREQLGFVRLGGVAWLNKAQKIAVLLHTGLISSSVRFYDTTNTDDMNSSLITSLKFPSQEQPVSSNLSSVPLRMEATSANTSVLYLYTDEGKFLALPPSRPGYYSVPYLSLERTADHVFVHDSAQCPPRTYKSDAGIWPCSPCRSAENTTCSQCTKEEFCPGEFITSLDDFHDILQIQYYPKSSESDVFDDIILYTIFRTPCTFISPSFLLLLVLAFVLLVTALIYLMKVKKRLRPKQKSLLKFFRHLDLIGQGKLWFGGLISVPLLFLVAIASWFSYIYHQQYPIQRQEQFHFDYPCHSKHLLNAKFQTSLQFFTSPSEPRLEGIHKLLNTQPFVMHLDIIHTNFHCGHLRFKHTEVDEYLPFSCYQRHGALYTSVSLPGQRITVLVELHGNRTIAALRLGLSAVRLADQLKRNEAQALNFSKRLNISGRRLSQNARVNLDLTKVINITEGLTYSDETTFSGLWTSTYVFDVNQVFVDTLKPLSVSSVENAWTHLTTLSIAFRETSFFVENKQEPIARQFEIIFHTILFIGVCIDLLALVFLLLKLWLIPLWKILLKKLLRPSNGFYRFVFETDTKDSNTDDLLLMKKELDHLKLQIREMNENIQQLIRANDKLKTIPLLESYSLPT